MAGISDIPGPVTLLGLAPTEGGGRILDPVYIVKPFDSSKPTTILAPPVTRPAFFSVPAAGRGASVPDAVRKTGRATREESGIPDRVERLSF